MVSLWAWLTVIDGWPPLALIGLDDRVGVVAAIGGYGTVELAHSARS
ncbi:MAG: hypothetical protein WBQ05_08720 [Candidatus Competibacter denitrificans]